MTQKGHSASQSHGASQSRSASRSRSVSPSRGAAPASKRPEAMGFSFQEDLWFGDFDDDAAREAAASSMAAMAGRIMGARPFPAAAQKLVQLTRNENTNIMKVVRVLESDPGLSQRVLRLVNSAGYGLRVRCTSLNHATALLGQQRLQQIATSAVLLNHFGRPSDETKRKQEHGALVASLCRYLAIHLGLPQEDLFTCGLLHDLGQLMMLDEGEKGYRELVLEHEEQWDRLHIAERETMGFDHAVLAAHVLASWSIPAPVPEVIALHHQPALAHQRGAKISAMVQTLRFADHMAHLLETSNQKEGPKVLADSEAASYLGFSEVQISAMWGDLRQLHQANLNRRMDIADIAPRSVSVPASLAPRAIAITDAAVAFSENPPPSLHFTNPPSQSSSANGEPVHEPVSSGETPDFSSQRLRLEEATPAILAPITSGEVEKPETTPRSFDSERPSAVGAAPEIFPCALCYGPTFGAQCPVCAAHVCSAHQTEGEQWCVACEDEFIRFRATRKPPEMLKIATFACLAIAAPSAYLFFGAKAALGMMGLFLTLALAGYSAHQGWLKAEFKRTRMSLNNTREEEAQDTSPEITPGSASAAEYVRNFAQQENIARHEFGSPWGQEQAREGSKPTHVEAQTQQLEQEALTGNPLAARASMAHLLRPSHAPIAQMSWPAPASRPLQSWPPSQLPPSAGHAPDSSFSEPVLPELLEPSELKSPSIGDIASLSASMLTIPEDPLITERLWDAQSSSTVDQSSPEGSQLADGQSTDGQSTDEQALPLELTSQHVAIAPPAPEQSLSPMESDSPTQTPEIQSDHAEPTSDHAEPTSDHAEPLSGDPEQWSDRQPSQSSPRGIVPLSERLVPADLHLEVPPREQTSLDSTLPNSAHHPNIPQLLSEEELDDWANAGSFRPRLAPAGMELSVEPAIEVLVTAPSPETSCDALTTTVVITPPVLLEASTFCSNDGINLVRILPRQFEPDRASS